MESESRRKDDRCDNKDTCPFVQDLCVKFNVIFTVNAELDQDSINVSCSR